MTLAYRLIDTICSAFLVLTLTFSTGIPVAGAKSLTLPDTLKSPGKLYAEAKRYSQYLFNGPRYHVYDRTADRHQFFKSRDMADGTLRYDGREYGPYKMNYDTHWGIVVIQQPENGVLIQLDSTKIENFTIGDSYFEKMTVRPGATNSIYQHLYNGRIKLICKRKKNRFERSEDRTVKVEFIPRDFFYIDSGNGYQRITSKKALYQLFPGNKREIRAALRRFPPAFRRETEEKLLEVVKIVDQSETTR